MLRTVFRISAVLSLVFLAGVFALYAFLDKEIKDLDDAARSSAPGKFIRLSKGYVHYELKGEENKPVVILIHGAGSGYYAWDNNFYEIVSAGYRVLRYDLYGRGLSDRPDVEYDLQLFADQLRELTDSLYLQAPYHLVSVSMGAMLAIDKSVNDAEHIGKVVFIDPAAIDKGDTHFLLKTPIVRDLMMTIYWAPRAVEKQMKEFYRPSAVKEYAGKSEVQLRYKGLRRAMLSTWLLSSNRNMDEELKIMGKQNREVLLLWGKNDPLTSIRSSVKYKTYIPQIQYAEIDRAGHLANYEQPDVVNKLIIDFLKD